MKTGVRTSSSAKAAPERVDGRRERSRSSHRRIVEAMLELINGGDLAPSAARVAEEAGIGLRTVFRHFDDMDSLYAEITATITERVMPIVTAPYPDQDWRTNVRELVRRRVRVFETTLPFRLAANIKRYQSPFLMGQYSKVVMLERDLILRLLPGEVLSDRVSVEALCAALSFQNWRALRHDQGLPAEEAATVMGHMVDTLIAALPKGGAA
ncbi:TetR/AcrR family transcriptional regulator [Sphingopyxis macrogoltabida]|uniref:TetR family transcriptional regulator n=1 Tax=Sphingopyxis macrogoltabida TaxID=33050 RepID=A0AAC8YZ78_SPHMC|nr:TetR/AcrR family transcriptional regulator [Sphingopyxis macrogoltabida]ALJ13652.1 TetR family transcriptional regulator [Sphingopyxis macrogoltabida]AMU88904.1 TetR family transcriptional regulator [Sphingopyxis macrogoltabida]